jgi:hypothetical protein
MIKFYGWPVTYLGIVMLTIGTMVHVDEGVGLITGGVALILAGFMQVVTA